MLRGIAGAREDRRTVGAAHAVAPRASRLSRPAGSLRDPAEPSRPCGTDTLLARIAGACADTGVTASPAEGAGSRAATGSSLRLRIRVAHDPGRAVLDAGLT